jgi:tripeptide aminopeptidase
MKSLLERFTRYVKIESSAVEEAGTYPSSPGQLEMGKLLTRELLELGISDAVMDDHGIVMGTVPGNVAGAPVIAWIAHVDTSPEFTADNVKPIVHENYDGTDIVLPGAPSRVIRPSENEELAALVGKTIITTDGTTLLGADDKAGVAVIMEAAAHLLAHPEIKRGDIRICFTCDEEIGHGVDHVDLKTLGARVGYTLDGEGQSYVEFETFSADLATVTVTGINTHPGYAKGKMVNAIRIASEFIRRMPTDRLDPSVTDGREGFVHPYVFEGGVPESKIRILLRDFDAANLVKQRALLEDIAGQLSAEYPKAKIVVDVQKQYRNMAEGIAKEPRAVDLAREAMRKVGIEPQSSLVRGGTDGSRLTEMGLPTPNLSTGMHDYHSPKEWACLEEMESAVRVLVELAQLWGAEAG